PEAFAYTLTWGPFDVCGEYEGTNTASFVTNDTEATGSSAWTVTVSVPCGPNCTLSHGYWKTHSAYGPAAKVDPTWLLLPQGPDQPFFESGYTWLSVIQAPSRGGDAYIILGRQYAAAWLNGLRGANVSAVADELQRAADLLDAYDGTPNAMSMITGDLRAEFIQLAELLDGFNNGLVGPGKCPEDDGSAS
ncbi:MAG: hypothetical protein OER21_14255, partial [Gemmatimonadota bacterium]|nr:hypothetical protein [Gemmatimonadota bacterium]